MSLLEAETLSKAYGGIRALDTCSISVEQGTIAGLIGPNGSGKTTLFNVITGYERVDAGEIRFKGKPITNLRPDKVFSMGIGRTFQLTRIFPRLTVMENMHVAAQRQSLRGILGRWSSSQEHKHALELLDFVGITRLKDTEAANLSYGQKKLLEFAFILIAEPEVILLDEPAGGINPTVIEQITERIRTLNKRGVTFLIVEHNFARCLMLDPTLILLDEPSMGLDPKTLKQVFDTITLMHQTGRTILLVEQNVRTGLGIATHGVVMESGRVRLKGTNQEILNHPQISHLYLGGMLSGA